MLLIGASPPGRNIEQHDIFFGIGESLKDLVPSVLDFWPEAKTKIHFDAWREVTRVNGYNVKVVETDKNTPQNAAALFFINLGGYKKDEFEEFHYKMLIAAPAKADAINISKQTAFFHHTGFTGANSHIDDRYGIDVDDVYEIRDILDKKTKEKYHLEITVAKEDTPEDEIHLGYFKLSMFMD